MGLTGSIIVHEYVLYFAQVIELEREWLSFFFTALVNGPVGLMTKVTQAWH